MKYMNINIAGGNAISILIISGLPTMISIKSISQKNDSNNNLDNPNIYIIRLIPYIRQTNISFEKY